MIITDNGIYTVKPCCRADISDAMNFFGREWKKEHVLATSRDYVDRFFYNPAYGLYNILLAYDRDGGVAGMLTYVPNTRFDAGIKEKFIWICNWLAAKGSGTGLLLTGALSAHERTKNLGTVGNNEEAGRLYGAMRYRTGELKHYFFVNANKSGFVILSNYKTPRRKSGRNDGLAVLRKLDAEAPVNISGDLTEHIETARPIKTIEYLKNKYGDNRYYNYRFYGIEKHGCICGVIILRVVEHEGARALRIVEYTGSDSHLPGLGECLQGLCEHYDAEYIDFYCSGVAEDCILEAGFELNNGEDGLIVPDYFEPFYGGNITIRYAYNIGGARIFRGDCDREHPRLLIRNNSAETNIYNGR